MAETPRLGHQPIAMVRLAGDRPHGRRPQPGEFYWQIEDGRRSLVIAMPCQGGTYGLFCEWSIDFKNHCGAQWTWDGNEDQPTLSPSLHAVGWWHGWCRAGELVEA